MRELKIFKHFTSREEESVNKYLVEINKYPMITPEEEIKLAKKIHEGDKAALDKLVLANLRFVVSVAKQYQNQGFSLGELINEGNLGLIKAADRFDETRGFKFISYAVWWIRQSILQALAEKVRMVRLPLNNIGVMTRVLKKHSELEQILEREPTYEEIAESLGAEISVVNDAFLNFKRHISLDASSSGEEGEDTLLDMFFVSEKNPEVTPDNELIYESLKKHIRISLSQLSVLENDILKLYYGLEDKAPMNLGDISNTVGLTSERVRQIKEKALKKLRKGNQYKVLKSYLK